MTQKSYGLEYHHLILLLFIGSSYLVSAVLTSATYVVLPTGWIGIPHVIHILFACSSHPTHVFASPFAPFSNRP
ncbi:Uncharacterized protein APZ42_003509, partial [Daphnia magna]